MGTAISFDGVDDQMVYNSPVEMLGALTMMIVVKILNTSDVAWLSFIENENSSGLLKPSIGRTNAGTIYFANNAASSKGGALVSTNGWCIAAVTKVAGSTNPDMHRLIIGGARTTTVGDTALGNDSAYASGNTRIGGNDDFANIEVACAAFWAGTVLTTGQLDGINTAKTSQSILDLTPSWMVDASDGLIVDQAGTVDRTSVVGTTAGASDPTGWTYLGGSAGLALGTIDTTTFPKPNMRGATR